MQNHNRVFQRIIFAFSAVSLRRNEIIIADEAQVIRRRKNKSHFKLVMAHAIFYGVEPVSVRLECAAVQPQSNFPGSSRDETLPASSIWPLRGETCCIP